MDDNRTPSFELEFCLKSVNAVLIELAKREPLTDIQKEGKAKLERRKDMLIKAIYLLKQNKL